MAVQRIDAQIQSLISGARQDTQKEVDKDDAEYEARKRADKKIQIKKAQHKEGLVNREGFKRQDAVQQKMQQILGGAAGQDAADGLHTWQDNKQLQAKLTEGQKNLFREAMAKNPPKAAKAAKAMDNLAKQPGFEQSVRSSQQMGTLQKALLDAPQLEKAAGEVLQSKFMQAPKADVGTKNRFMDFGLRQANKGQLQSVKQAGDLLGTMAKAKVGREGQKATMAMINRNPTDAKAMKNVDAFMANPNVGKMPSFARTKATALLAKADGKGEVKEGFEKLAGDSKFKAQTAENKGRFFSTIGSGKASEFRGISDKLLSSLQSKDFPARSGQVQQLLTKAGQQVAKGGAKQLDMAAATRAAKASPMPKLTLVPESEDMDEEERLAARSKNRANVMQFFNKLQRMYEQGEKQLNSAKYLEDVNGLRNLRQPEDLDFSALSPEERAFAEERSAKVQSTLNRVLKLQKQRARELRRKRMPPAKRRARAAKRRAQGAQPKYFNPNTGRGVPASAAFLQATGTDARRQPLASTPQRAVRQQAPTQAGGGIEQQIQNAVANLGGQPLTADNIGQVASNIAQTVATQVAQQVTQSLMGQLGESGPSVAPPVTPKAAPAVQQGKVDGWGIPRSFERDLGAAQRQPVKPIEDESWAAPEEAYTGKVLVKDPSTVRQGNELFGSTWKELNKGELALLKNLGWNQQAWDTKDTAAAKWPRAMATPFIQLTTLQREAVRKLGFTAHDWDTKVQALQMGQNA